MGLRSKLRHFLLVSAVAMHQCMPRGPSLRGLLVAAQSTNTSNPSGGEDDLADFGQTVPILGLMERTDQDFKDGLALDLFSPRNRTLVVTQNKSPLSGKFVTGSTGEPFAALSNYSWIIKVNDNARDLIAKVELPYDAENVRRMGFDVANTYVGVLSRDGKSWNIDESRRNVHVSENKTRIIKLTSLDGEYMLLGRQAIDTSNIFVQYGFGATRTVNLTGGEGIQQAEFVDGLRFTLESERQMQINVDLKNGVNDEALPRGMQSLNSFAWVVNTSAPNQQLKSGSVNFPVNPSLLSASNSSGSIASAKLTVAKRDISSSSKFSPLSQQSQKVVCQPECVVSVSDLQKLDGEYILLTTAKMSSKEEAVTSPERLVTSAGSSIYVDLRRIMRWPWAYMTLYLYVIYCF